MLSQFNSGLYLDLILYMKFSFILVFVQEISLFLTHHIILLAPLTNH